MPVPILMAGGQRARALRNRTLDSGRWIRAVIPRHHARERTSYLGDSMQGRSPVGPLRCRHRHPCGGRLGRPGRHLHRRRSHRDIGPEFGGHPRRRRNRRVHSNTGRTIMTTTVNTALAALAATFIASAHVGAATTLRAGSVLPPSSDQGQAAEHFAKRVGELTNGELTVQVFHSGELGSPPSSSRTPSPAPRTSSSTPLTTSSPTTTASGSSTRRSCSAAATTSANSSTATRSPRSHRRSSRAGSCSWAATTGCASRTAEFSLAPRSSSPRSSRA